MLLTSPSSYRGEAFLRAANQLDLEAIQVFDIPATLKREETQQLSIEFHDVARSTDWIVSYHERNPLTALVSVDDSATELAAVASQAIGLPANDPIAAQAARDKFLMRSILNRQGVECPAFRLVETDEDPAAIADGLEYPIVLKPRRLSGSRGVIRADSPDEFVSAFERVRRILAEAGEGESSSTILIESYLPGDEVAVEGLMTDGSLRLLAIFDKPDPLVGPFFEETIYTTPSRHPVAVQEVIKHETELAALALGLRHGPVHAELRINQGRATILEIAGRSIGGL